MAQGNVLLLHIGSDAMKYFCLFLSVISLILVGCSGDKDEPQSAGETIIGYWALTHVKTIECTSGIHTTNDKDIPPAYDDSYAGVERLRWNVLIFDEDFVTVRGDMPNRPKSGDYNMNTPDGQVLYLNDVENWNNSIGQHTDDNGCPVGSYIIRGDDLIIGLLNMGSISFSSDNEFTLKYEKTMTNPGDYQRLIYTYYRIYSLNK